MKHSVRTFIGTAAAVMAGFGLARAETPDFAHAAVTDMNPGVMLSVSWLEVEGDAPYIFWLFCKIGHGIPCPICCMKQHSPSTTGCKHANDRPLWAFDGPGAVFTCSQPCAARFGSTRCEQAA